MLHYVELRQCNWLRLCSLWLDPSYVGLTAPTSSALKVPGQNIIRHARVPIVTFETKVGTAGMVNVKATLQLYYVLLCITQILFHTDCHLFIHSFTHIFYLCMYVCMFVCMYLFGSTYIYPYLSVAYLSVFMFCPAVVFSTPLESAGPQDKGEKT